MSLLLQALLAFAVTMLALATIVTLIMEFLTRISRRRGRVFGHMIGLVFEKEIWPYVKQHYSDASLPDKTVLQNFKKAIQTSPLESDNRFAPVLSPLISLFAADRSDQLTTEEFVRRLARSDLGSQLYTEAQEQLDRLVERVCLRYDELADASSEYFKNSSAVVSLIIGVVFAFAANLDGYKVIDFYVTNPDVAESVSKKADALLEKQERANERLQSALDSLEDDTVSEVDAKVAEEDLQDTQAVLDEARAQIERLAVLGVPVGWSQFPYCRPISASSADASDTGETDDSRTAVQGPSSAACEAAAPLDAMDSRYLLRMLLPWVLTTALTGFLIGLGGPFWFDAVVGLMRATQMLRGRLPSAERQGAEQRAQEPSPTPLEIFTQHVESHNA